MSGISCIIIGGVLWMSIADSNRMVQPSEVFKGVDSERVTIYTTTDGAINAEISEQYQLRMGSEEFLANCVHSGYAIPEQEFLPYDDIDDEEHEFVE